MVISVNVRAVWSKFQDPVVDLDVDRITIGMEYCFSVESLLHYLAVIDHKK
jgi:hypothetical protein